MDRSSTLSPLFARNLQLSGIKHAFFTREGGVSDGIYAGLNGGLGSNDNPHSIRENRARIADFLQIPAGNLVSLYQIHSNIAVVVPPIAAGGEINPVKPFVFDENQRPQADAMVTRVPNLALTISTADCGSVLFADPVARVVGAAHAGWKGALGGVLENTLAAMEGLGAQRARVVTALGPMLSLKNYEVGEEFYTNFIEKNAKYASFFEKRLVLWKQKKEESWHFNLPAFIMARLREAGVNNIENLDLCTYDDANRFYSYRRKTHQQEPDYGRLISAIYL